PGTVNGYGIYGKYTVDASGAAYYVFAIDATATNTPIGADTTLWLDTNDGAEYNVFLNPADGKPYVYTGDAGQTLVGSTPLPFASNSTKTIVQFAVPVSQLAGNPQSIDVSADVNGQVFVPTSHALAAANVSASTSIPIMSGTITPDGTTGAAAPVVA